MNISKDRYETIARLIIHEWIESYRTAREWGDKKGLKISIAFDWDKLCNSIVTDDENEYWTKNKDRKLIKCLNYEIYQMFSLLQYHEKDEIRELCLKSLTGKWWLK